MSRFQQALEYTGGDVRAATALMMHTNPKDPIPRRAQQALAPYPPAPPSSALKRSRTRRRARVVEEDEDDDEADTSEVFTKLKNEIVSSVVQALRASEPPPSVQHVSVDSSAPSRAPKPASLARAPSSLAARTSGRRPAETARLSLTRQTSEAPASAAPAPSLHLGDDTAEEETEDPEPSAESSQAAPRA